MTDNPPKQHDIKVCNHIVTYIDVLGQKECLAKLPKVLLGEGKTDELMRSLKDTYGRVHNTRQTLEHYFNSAIHKQSSAWHSILSSEQKDILKNMDQSDIRSQHFGDAMIFYSNLSNSQGILNLSSSMMMLGGCAMIMIVGLQAGIPLRGGIEIGIAADWPEFGIYGSALYGAYDIAERVAQYPRIVIGEELKKYLISWKNDIRDDPFHLINRKIADICLSFIIEDQDGIPIVDFLNIHSLRDLFGDQNLRELKDLVIKGFNFVKSEQARYKEEKNTKLAFRYCSLLDYYIDRLAGWEFGE